MLEDLSGKKFGHITFLEFDHYGNDWMQYWKVKCDCGKEYVAQKYSIINGNTVSCGCERDKKLRKHREQNKKDLTGKIFGRLTVLYEDKTKKYRKSQWFCECVCGNIVSVRTNSLTSGHTLSCGCLTSIREELTNEILSHIHIDGFKWSSQVSFDDLKYKGKLLFDYGIYIKDKLMCLIELNGMQHYQNGKEFGKVQREITDNMKIDYCKKNNIPLETISYKEDLLKKLQEILRKYMPTPCQAL